MTMRTQWLLPGALLAGGLVLSGCGGVAPAPGATPSSTAKMQQKGRVFGGQQPIHGATIQLYAVNPATMQGASAPLLTSTVTTDSVGFFDITGKYSCPTGAMAYIVSTAGDAGAGNNNMAVLMAGLGPCAALIANPVNIQMNEVTTVAAVYALRPFMLDAYHVGTSAANVTGMNNAFSMMAVLADTSTGYAPGPLANGSTSVPAALLYSLANVIAACVNSAGAASPQCSSLSTLAHNASGTAAVDTVSALVNMATLPAQSATAIFNLAGSSPIFTPVLSSAPHDLTVAVQVNGLGIQSPHSVAVDAQGNAWITNSASSAVTKLSPSLSSLSGPTGITAGGLLGPAGIAIDASGNAWVANAAGDSVVKLSSTGAALSGAHGFTAGGINGPVDIAIDKNGNAWVVNFSGGTVSALTSAGTASSVNLSSVNALLSRPTSVGVDVNGNIWVASGGNGTVVSFASASGSVNTGAGLTDGWLQGTGQIALDASGTSWTAAPGINALSSFNASFVPAASPNYNGGLGAPQGVAIDGAGAIWVTNKQTGGSVSALAAGSGAGDATRTDLGALNAPQGVAIDGGGNVWTANSGDNTVTVIVGVATPATVPLVAQLP